MVPFYVPLQIHMFTILLGVQQDIRFLKYTGLEVELHVQSINDSHANAVRTCFS